MQYYVIDKHNYDFLDIARSHDEDCPHPIFRYFIAYNHHGRNLWLTTDQYRMHLVRTNHAITPGVYMLDHHVDNHAVVRKSHYEPSEKRHQGILDTFIKARDAATVPVTLDTMAAEDDILRYRPHRHVDDRLSLRYMPYNYGVWAMEMHVEFLQPLQGFDFAIQPRPYTPWVATNGNKIAVLMPMHTLGMLKIVPKETSHV